MIILTNNVKLIKKCYNIFIEKLICNQGVRIMNNTQKQFVDILSASIRGKKITNVYDSVNWNEILHLAEAHKVEGIIYSGLSRSGLTENIEEEQLKSLKRSTFNTGVEQLRNIKNLSNVFSKFNEENIPVIVLKGLVIREFYPRPEQRSMCDADILVHKNDVEKVKDLLIEMGYVFLEDHKASHHIALVHRYNPMVEVHWHLFKRDGFSSELGDFEKLIWKDVIKLNVGDAEVLSLGYEDLALHLCMHMAAHIVSSGFGLRQLCDLVLLIENKGDLINWDKFITKASMYGFEKFSLIIFILCKELFGMEIPSGIKVEGVNNKRYIYDLIEEIFEAGVHGKKDITSSFGNQVAFNFEEKDNNATLGAIKRYLNLIFPKVQSMSNKYGYAKKFRILTPIAWIHHLISGIFIREYSYKEKFSFLTRGASVAINKNKLLEWMEL